ncbi:MoxR family ATPase [Simiduia curdlanivorans]|uniref:AAA family ATPase n=1 Tax=Simiduia curdlanivorans TaxID=1492769 RepID=A0ABV8V885_9GAMM|nr:MoxR family ATPase [Simiduia curdlanivorans]MDN3639543.1 MoxR family ATPase [Simiduia curdlanivorans]
MTTHSQIQVLKTWLNNQIVGQNDLIDRLLIALLADGHLLVEGAPGLAKTKAIKLLAKGIEGSFHRIQFTPDLLPADVTGTDIYRAETSSFEFQKGPIFHNLVLADEINRAPAKVQSALLEAMAERQITVGKHTYPLADLFLVMATQNPIEQEGTYPLPEAQLDRFLLHVRVSYPSAAAEKEILRLVREENLTQEAVPPAKISQTDLLNARKSLLQIHLAESVEDYIVHLIDATRHPINYDAKLAQWLEYGASPRATLALERSARALAWLDGRDFVTPADVQALAPDVLRHRLILTFEAEASGVTIDQVIEHLLDVVPAA